MPWHIIRRNSAHRQLLDDLDTLELGCSKILDIPEKRLARCLQSTISWQLNIEKQFRTHYVNGKFFIVRVK